MDQARSQFLRILIDDVQRALDRTASTDTQSDRRNLLRTIISAAEGASWIYRVHVLSVAQQFDVATPQIEMAFAEASFSVSGSGEIVEQARYIPLTAMIRLTTNVAQSFCPGADVDFGDAGWQKLRIGIAARNRITHPKNDNDLILSDAEIEAAKAGFFWFLDISANVMEKTVKAYSELVADLKQLGQELQSGDPEALELYRRVHQGQGE
ncbi:hypothetical protein [Sphingobium sp. YR768]|uniref:hypothetical protein n=1 Tax=Sphingobium sp. YR768 TaxID=1884365 RepID=UPI0008B87AF8|nr:hypothetical protein [Sphingobium sp. YR768]SEQ90994.1 hypothetical protein SAMN05518866_103330 [Sphingobium sp. YR768]